MTKVREEQMIGDLGEIKGILQRFSHEFDDLKPTLAKCSDVTVVDDKIERHLKGHLNQRSFTLQWIAILVTFMGGGYGFIKIVSLIKSIGGVP